MQDDIRDRYRTPRRPKTAVPQTPRPAAPAGDEPKPPAKKPKKSRQKLLFSLLILIIIIALAAGVWFYKHRTVSPVPKNIQKQLSYKPYYPDQKQLPQGYSLLTSTFSSPSKDVLVYKVNFGGYKQLAFSTQPRPSQNDLNDFNSHRIPIHVEFSTKFGKADLGIIGNQAVVSLPADSQWIIITGPQNLREAEISPVLTALIR